MFEMCTYCTHSITTCGLNTLNPLSEKQTHLFKIMVGIQEVFIIKSRLGLRQYSISFFKKALESQKLPNLLSLKSLQKFLK